MSKDCSRCKTNKCITDFYKSTYSNDGYRSECKACKIEYSKHYYDKNKDKIDEYQRQYYVDNKERIHAYLRNYRKTNNT